MKFNTPRLLGSLISDLSSIFRNSDWRIKYGGAEFELKFQNVKLEFIISYCKNVRVPNMIPTLHFRPPYWIRHFEFLNVELGFVTSNPKNPWVPTFESIKPEELCILQGINLNIKVSLKSVNFFLHIFPWHLVIRVGSSFTYIENLQIVYKSTVTQRHSTSVKTMQTY